MGKTTPEVAAKPGQQPANGPSILPRNHSTTSVHLERDYGELSQTNL